MDKLNYIRKLFLDKYHVIEIFNCPINIILFAAELSSQNVTIENFSSYKQPRLIGMTLELGSITITPTILRCEADLKITRQQFLSLAVLWDKQGCYAVFHDKSVLKFKATNLDDHVRYKALDNFGWTLELAIPGPASSGWGQITSPSSTLIDKVETQIANYH